MIAEGGDCGAVTPNGDGRAHEAVFHLSWSAPSTYFFCRGCSPPKCYRVALSEAKMANRLTPNLRGLLLIDEALIHSTACRDLLEHENLKGALAYCVAQQVEPPQCSLTAISQNAERLRETTKRMLTDYGWWSKRLKLRAARAAEMRRIRDGLAALKR